MKKFLILIVLGLLVWSICQGQISPKMTDETVKAWIH